MIKIKQLCLCLCLVLCSQSVLANKLEIASVNVSMLNQDYFKSTKQDFRFAKLETAVRKHEDEKPADWDELVEKVKSQPDDYSKVALANLIANQIPYVDGTDGSYFHPLKGMKRGGVVCKDYAVFKYLLLKEAGFDTEKMALLIHQTVLNSDLSAHVVLIVDIDDELYIANQFWKRVANDFYKKHKINRNKLSSDIKKNGVGALKTDFDIESSYSKESLTKLEDYTYKDRIVFSIVNEYGVMVEKDFKLKNKKK